MNRDVFGRRTFLKSATIATGASLCVPGRGSASPPAEILETKVIRHQPQYYCGWPTLGRRRSGTLMVVWSGRREEHVCPFGTVQWMTSEDQGETWTWPRTLLDSAIDDRDAGVLETAAGSILVTTFSSLAYESVLRRAEEAGNWEAAKLDRWRAADRRLPPDQRRAELGTWMLRSTDGGRSWSARFDCLLNSPHGPTQLRDGRIVYAGKQLWRDEPRIGVAVSSDDGVSWEWLATIPHREGDDPNQYHELHAIETADGRIIAQIRNHNANHARETLQSESSDGGETWSVPRSIGVWGLPSHLSRLSDDRLLMTYGHRRPPFGNQARVSEDQGRTWSEPITISGDGAGGDLGYPSTVELDDGTLVSVWYEKLASAPRAVLRQARWRLRG